LVQQAGGKAPTTMQSFTKLVDKVGPPPAPGPDAPAVLPPPAPSAPGTSPDVTSIPTLAEVGYTSAPTTIFRGGETEALQRLQQYMADASWVCKFEKPSTDPSAFTQPATTVLSPYLKFGCVSPRLFYQELHRIYSAAGGKHSQPPVSLRGQLLWREFFYMVSVCALVCWCGHNQ
jgi:cryptochrome